MGNCPHYPAEDYWPLRGGLIPTFRPLSQISKRGFQDLDFPAAPKPAILPMRSIMSRTISIEQASAQLGGLVRALGPNDEIVLTDNDKPVARIVPSKARHTRVAGAWKGMLTIVKDDDSHLEEFKEYMP
jgi:antitoxin (DNA-binding transcriptional repressor) of toxin-antitoxin stability system